MFGGKEMIIGVDFDGTCVTHEFPKVGKEIGAVPVLKALTEKGHQLILFTMRSDIVNPQSEDYDIEKKGGNYLTQAVEWFRKHDIPLFGINENPTQKTWTTSPKPYCHIYIDDAALGVPLLSNSESDRPFVNWYMVSELLRIKGLL